MNETLERYGRLVAALKAAPEGLTIPELSRILGTNQVQVRSDLELLSLDLALSSCGSGPETEERWFLAYPSAVVPILSFTSPELLAMLAALSGETDPTLTSIRRKLFQARFLGEQQPELEWKAKRLLIKGPRGLYEPPELKERVEQLEEAILDERRLDIEYSARSGEKLRLELAPYGLIYYWVWGFWYLIGAGTDGLLREFRVDRICSLTKLDVFSYPEGFSLEERFADSWGVELDGPLVEVGVRFYDEYNVIAKVKQETAHRRNRRIIPEKGSILYYDRIRGLSEIQPWLRSYGSSAVVLEPAELRAEMIRGAQWVVDLYDLDEEAR